MKNFLFSLLCFLSLNVLAQKKVTLSGTITAAENGEELIGATVAVPALNTGVGANVYGF